MDCFLIDSKALCISDGVHHHTMLNLMALALRSVCGHRFGNQLNALALLLALHCCRCCLSGCCWNLRTMAGFPLGQLSFLLLPLTGCFLTGLFG